MDRFRQAKAYLSRIAAAIVFGQTGVDYWQAVAQLERAKSEAWKAGFDLASTGLLRHGHHLPMCKAAGSYQCRCGLDLTLAAITRHRYFMDKHPQNATH